MEKGNEALFILILKVGLLLIIGWLRTLLDSPRIMGL